jgi:hypothetical protein
VFANRRILKGGETFLATPRKSTILGFTAEDDNLVVLDLRLPGIPFSPSDLVYFIQMTSPKAMGERVHLLLDSTNKGMGVVFKNEFSTLLSHKFNFKAEVN